MAIRTESRVDYKKLFEHLNGHYVVIEPNDPDFTILDITDAQAESSMVGRYEVTGKSFLEAFPDSSDEYTANGNSTAIKNLRTAIKTRKPVHTPVTRYDIFDKSGNKVERYWQSSIYPVLDDSGEVVLIFTSNKDITEEHKSGEKLGVIRSQLEDAVLAGNIGTWSWDVQKNNLVGGKNFSFLYNIDEEAAAKGIPTSALVHAIHEEDQKRVKAETEAALKDAENFESEYRTIARDGKIHWLIARGRIKRDTNGTPLSFAGVSVDITERKIAEEKLRGREREFHFMANSMPQLIWVTRPDGYHEYYNQQWYEYTDTSPEQTEGDGWNHVFHPDDRARAWKLWKDSLKTGKLYEIEYRLWHEASKEYRWNVGRALPLRNDKGKIVKWYGTCTDIHDQKITAMNQTFLAEASKILNSTLDYNKTLKSVARLMVPGIADWCGIDLLSENNQLQQVAVAHKDPKKVKWAKELRKEQGPPDLNEPTGVPNVLRTGKSEFYPFIPDELLKNAAKSKEEYELMKKIGFTSVIIVPLKLRNDTIGAITLVTAEQQRHYTEADLAMAEELATRASLAMTNSSLYTSAHKELEHRQKLEKELRVANQDLERRVKRRTKELERTNTELVRSNRELEDFAYVASHDLQEPLRKIQAFSNLLEAEHGKVLGDGKDYLDRMRNAAARMSTLIEDLLEFSRVTTHAREFSQVDLNRVAKEVIEDLENRINGTGGKVNISDLPTICADSLQMRQLLQNLIGNALKFHKPDNAPVVKVYAKQSKSKDGKMDTCTLYVEDNGVGFDEKYLDRIFSVFQRLHSRSTYDGTGIGLAVCRKIVERHNGTITAKSTPDKGSTFIIKLPTGIKK